MASAKLANNTVNHSQSVICRLKLNASCGCTISRIVVITLPISTTNITGFPIMWRGFSFSTEFQAALRTSFKSQIDLRWLPMVPSLESLACVQQKMFENWSETERREERQRPQYQYDADQQKGEQGRRDRKRAQRRRHILLLSQITRNRKHRNDHEESANEHRQSDCSVVPQRVYREATKRGAVIPRPRRKGVQNLAESVRPGIADARDAESFHHRDPRQRKNDEREYQRHQHCHLDVVGLDLLAQILRCTAHHQSGNEDCQHDVDQDAVHARSHSAENDFAEHDVDERNHAAQWRERVMPAIDRATTRVSGDGRKQGGTSDAEACLLPFHVPAGLRVAHMLRHCGGI